MAKKILVTGSAGFVGFHLVNALVKRGDKVVGIDNLNDYYSVSLKYDRLSECGIDTSDVKWHEVLDSSSLQYRFIRMNLEDKGELNKLFEIEKFDFVINMAAQAGVRYSIENPDAYIQSNVVGFLNLLECCRHYHIKHFVYASSSSVYGMNENMPFSVKHNVDHPVSLYAATKKSNELMAHCYSHLYNISTTGLRFFTVYGPWGRPDMAYFLFTNAILAGKSIKVFNNGDMERDFTYIDDIVNGVINVTDCPSDAHPAWSGADSDPSRSKAPYRIYNIGNDNPVRLMDFINEIGRHLHKEVKMEMLPMQPGDVKRTWADVEELIREFDYKPQTTIDIGIKKFVEWYKNYYK